ncbi:MAG TPA: hypothetical protein VKE69_05090 [Planctomycetota bacterium]|nr:hypothetical protein [Planctomycetota bacterium]
MKRTLGTLVAAAAAGILGAGVTLSCKSESSGGAQASAMDKHACKGMNACAGKGNCKSGDHGCAGKNSCKGKGGCAAADAKHGCKGMNSCKGMGGCKSGDAGCAGKNSCKGKGGCAVPAKM